MATGDPDGKIMQVLQDRQTCLSMELGEWALDVKRQMDDLLGPDWSTF